MKPFDLPQDPALLLDPWCRALLARAVRAAGLDPAAAPGADALAAAFRAPAKFRRLLDAYAALLRQPAATDADGLRGSLLRETPALAAHIALAEACAAALPAVLAGDVPATEVLFPGGSLSRVEPIYRDNPWADYFNRLTAEACLQVLEARLAQRPGSTVRIVEIGAGTGGTTGCVLGKLAERRDAFEYVYTDLSPGFVQHGRQVFGERGYRMEFRRLDIEQPPATGSPSLGQAHIVIATNVLHATRRIDRTLDHVRALAADDGLLLLNELTRADAFAALTFGLLDGWWCFEDGEQRLPHGPILSASGWRGALARSGFSVPAVYGWGGRLDGFQCLFVCAVDAAHRSHAPRGNASGDALRPAASQGTGSSSGASLPLTGRAPAQSAGTIGAVRRQVRAVLAQRLGFAEDEVGWDRPFAELGVDSIVAPQFAADLSETLRAPVDAVDIYNHGTVALLAEVLTERLPAERPAAEPQSAQADGKDDAIAVIGLACRFAGAVDAEAFWSLLEQGRDATAPLANRRWAGAESAMAAGLLPEADCFDPDFFRLSHAEAEVMDPQQRVFLEECWHALEDAGLGPHRLEGKACGVFVGVAAQNHPANQGEPRAALGNSNAILAARIAYHLNLKGPALPVDTACSSSLVAIHLAAQSILAGDCDLALAGGVSVLLCNQALPRFLLESGMVSPSGRCRAFDAAADGFVPGEGVGVVVLRRLSQALADGDRILGVIRAGGINQDGRTSGITAPSGPAQLALLQRVWQHGGIDPASLSLIEAHGTGTPLGDPIEVQSLAAAFGGKGRCALGSVKPNIGHTLTAAGVAGVAKVLLALRERTIPPSLHYRTPNPRLKLDASPFYVPLQAEPWQAAAPRRAAVSSFGFSGTNAHLVIEEAPPLPASPDGPHEGREPGSPAALGNDEEALLLLSAATPEALRRLAGRLEAWLERRADTRLADLCRTLNAGRAFLAERAALLAGDLETLRRALRTLAASREDAALVRDGASLAAAGETWRIQPGDDRRRVAGHFVAGGAADWERLHGGGRVLSLPGYPFARDRFPLPSEPAGDGVELLESILPAGDPSYTGHCWDGRAIFPATALLLLAARGQGGKPCVVEDVRWHSPLPAVEGTARLRLAAGGRMALESGEGCHAEAAVRAARPEETPRDAAWREPLPEGLGRAEVYRIFADMGFDYGPAFQVIERLAARDGRALAHLDWPAGAQRGRMPAIGLLDGVIQSALGLLGGGEQPATVLPVGLERAWIDAAGLTAPLRVEVREGNGAARAGERRLDLLAWNAAGQVAARLDGLAVRLLPARDPVEPLLYRPGWRLAEPPGDSPPPAAAVLLFDHGGERAAALGPGAILVEPGAEFRVHPGPRYQLPPGDADALAALAGDLAERGLQPDIWLNLWPLADTDAAEARLALGPLTLLHGLRAWLPRRDKTRDLRVLQAGSGDGGAGWDADPACAAAAALLHSLAGEEPRFSGKAVALPASAERWPRLLAELAERGGDSEIAWDGDGRRYVRAYTAWAQPGGADGLPQGAACLITGGYGGLGLALARHLWRTRRARLALLGRTPPKSLAEAELARLRAEGAEILELCADVADERGLRTALDSARQGLGGLDAVFHLAGAQADGFLRGLDAAAVDAVWMPKVAGTNNLLAALADSPDTRLVAFGSLAGAFGAPGQAAYAAANRAMDALLERERGRRVLALDWGYWDPAALAGGMATVHRDAASVSAATGLSPFAPEQAMALLEQALAAPQSGRLLLARGRRGDFEAFMAGGAGAAQASAGAPEPASADAVLAYLTGVVAEITRTPAERLNADRPLDAFGIDSIMITRLNARLERDLGRISKTLFFEYPNLRALAAHLAERYGANRAGPAAGASVAADAPGQGARSPAYGSAPDASAVAVIGMAGRFPQAANLEAYWRNLLSGRVCIEEIPPQRWPLEGFYDADPQRAGASYSKWGGFIDGVDRFDALFFNISPEEAARMDPQERLFLEVAWQCLEDAGLTRAALGAAGERDTAVYVGVMYGDYQLLAHDAAGPGQPIGGAAPYWSIANRASYVLGLEGPSLAVDSACSSSLTALHLACQALAAGDCRTALVGGVNLSLHPSKYIGLSQGRFASSDGRCRSFGDGGDGYVPGEGVAAVLLKPLAAALADGDVVHGVIRASAANHGGRGNGYTVPNPAAQAAVIRRALRRSGIEGSELGFIEAHGTGTRLGDPIEIEGLAQALGRDTPPGAIPLGSAKAAIGHLEAAAGLAGLIKVLLQMRHGRYAPMPLAGPVNADIDFAATPLRLQTQPADWPAGADGRRYAGVSSFGAGGANAHVILQDAPPRHSAPDDGAARVLPLSARTQAQVRALAGALAERLADSERPVSLADLCHTLTAGREALLCRCAFVARDGQQARALLADIASGREGGDVCWGEAPDDSAAAPTAPATDDLAALARHWCEGGAALWPHDGARRSLVARPFLGARHWLRGAAAPMARPEPVAPSSDWTRASRPAKDGEDAAWMFTLPADSTLLSQHVVGGERLLPGAAIVAMALSLHGGGLRDVAWHRPIRAGAQPLRLDFSLRGDAFSVREAGAEDAPLLASGNLAAGEAAPIPAEVPAGGVALGGGEFYPRLAELGLEYGERFRVVRRLWPGESACRAELESGKVIGLDAALLDGAFQSLAGLEDLDAAVRGEGVPLPHTLASVTVLGDPGQARQVLARRLTAPDEPVQRFELTLADEAGNALLHFGGLTARRRAIAAAEPPITLLRPVWVHRPAAPAKPGRVAILAAAGAEALAGELAARCVDARVYCLAAGESPVLAEQPATVYYYLDTAEGAPPPPSGSAAAWAEAAAARSLRLLGLLRTLDTASVRRLLVVTRAVCEVQSSPASAGMSDAAGLHGLAKVAARELPGVAVVAVDLPAQVDARALDLLAAEGGDADGAEIAYRHGRRHARRLQAVQAEAGEPLLSNGDACLIVGGTGGVGRTLAEHWARTHGARVALVGRRPADAEIDALLARLKALGGDGLYLQADAADPAALADAVARARSAFGPVRLAVHGALVLRDKALAAMDDADFLAAFAPRAAAGAAFIAAFGDQPPRAMLLFSSANVFLGQHGQGNYVAGNAALAALGRAARAQSLPVSLVHWGLWGEVGAVADQATQARFTAEGVLPIAPAQGAEILPAALAAGADVAAVRLAPQRMAAIEMLEQGAVCRSADAPPAVLDAAALAERLRGLAPPEGLESARVAFAALESVGLARLAGILRGMAGAAAGRRLTPARLLKELGVAPAYARLTQTLLARLAADGLAEQRDGLWRLQTAADLDGVSAERSAELAALEADRPWLAANRRLLEHCLDAYPAVLRGELAGASVLFPDGDTGLVSVAYQGNPVSDHANALLGAAVAAETEARLRAGRGPVRILEVGAGTGGSTLPLLAALAPWRGHVRYCATDLSPYLAKSLQDRCAEEGWEIQAGALDIGRAADPAEHAAWDIVVAANVVHATGDIAASLSHLKARLAPAGRLVLNELTASRDLGTLVFGLTPQWWSAEDTDSRFPDGPAAAPAVWLDLLAESGFVQPLLVGVEGEAADSSQSLITAVADGWMPVARFSQGAGRGEGETKRSRPFDPLIPTFSQGEKELRVPGFVDSEAEDAEGGDQLAAMLDYLKGVFAAVLGVDPADMRPGDTFERYGVESLSAMEIRNRIAADHPWVGSTLLFEYNTLQRLAERLLEQGAQQGAAVAATVAAPATVATAVAPPLPARDEPIAVIGFYGRFPGADTPDAFWSLLREGRSALGPVPADRWDHELYLDRGGQGAPAPGRCRSRWGGFIDGIDRFDPLFFGIAPLEADSMDPQERLFIEACWNAIEDAGTTPARLAEQARAGGASGSVGVFCGVMNTAYQWLAAEAWRGGDDRAASSHFWSIPNRVSYLLDFDGPSIALDTACSSSLTALHLACESLRRGECGAVLAGGVNVIAHPRQLVNLGQAGMIADGAECRAFGAGADGFVDGEGVGVALLKPLSRALADGDRIDGLIVGSAVNAGGKTGGYTVPNPRAQSQVIQSALARAGIGADGLCLVETHGTGTELGDPIEAAGLAGALGGDAFAGKLPLGTLKANIGHLESAAGIASFIKVLLQLRHQTIAPARHAATPNPLIRWDETPFRLPLEAEPWAKPAGRPRRAAISGFGAGGANAHLIVEEAPAAPRRAVPASPEWLPLSARSPAQLAELAGRMADAVAGMADSHAGSDNPTLLADLGRTLRLGRVEQRHGAWIAAHDLDELLAALRALARGEVPAAARPEGPLDGDPRARPLSLPTSPFDRQRYWIDVEPAPPGGLAGARPAVPEQAGDAAMSTHLLARRWRPAPLPRVGNPPLDILLIGGGTALADALAKLGHRVERLSPDGAELAACQERETEQCLVVVEARAGADDATPSIRAALELARNTARAAGPRRLLHVASLGENGAPLPASSAIAALFRSLAAETPGCLAGTLALEPAAPAVAASAIAEELAVLGTPGGGEILRRGGERLGVGIEPLAATAASAAPAFRQGGCYVLVGGLGEVGRQLVQALIGRYRARVAILGRTAADAVAALPAGVAYRSCDIGDPAALAAALAAIRRDHGAIHGVLHMARSVAPAPLLAMEGQSAAATLAPKTDGSLNLLRALREHRPDWLVFFSSLAAWAGQEGGADYAAACGYQDGLALAGGESPLVSVAWPQWEYDRYLDAAKRDLWSAAGLATLDAAAGLDALEQILRHGGGAYGVLRGPAAAVESIVRRLQGAAPSWEAQLAGLDGETLRAYRDYLRQRLAATAGEPVSSAASCADTVLAVCSDYLKIPPELMARASFAELGLDSIRALHLAERLQRRLQRPVEPVMLFENPTVERLALALAEVGEAS